jgi:CelD/BcsL family acetyltransferase involved in cellulose biosynthesis
MSRREPLSVVVVPVDTALSTLREWRRADPSTADDPTLSPEWLEIWWRHFGNLGTAEVLCLVSPEGNRVGLLFTHHDVERHYHVPVRTIRCWVNSHAQRASLFLRCDADAAAEAIIAHWARCAPQWDLLRLQGMPEGAFARALMRHAAALRCRCLSVRTWAHSRLEIDRSWEDYFRRVISTDTRKEVERQGRRLDELGSTGWRNHGSTEAMTVAFDDFMKVEAASWKQLAGETIASRPTLVAFYRDVLRSFATKGEALVTVLYLDNSPICASLNLLARGRLLSLKTSFDERFAKYSPGSQLYRHLIAHAFREGLKEVDFYGKMAFSQRWTKDERCFIDLQILGPTMRSRLIGLAKDAANWWSVTRKVGEARAT